MNNPQSPERHEKFLTGVNARLDEVHKRSTFSPPHCEECGRKATEYFRTSYMTVCDGCLRPADRAALKRRN